MMKVAVRRSTPLAAERPGQLLRRHQRNPGIPGRFLEAGPAADQRELGVVPGGHDWRPERQARPVGGFGHLAQAAIAPGALDSKTKELMALSISIVTKCEPCMEWYLDQAMQTGATDEEIYETVDVAIEMGGGQAGAYGRFVLKAMEYFKDSTGK